MLSLGQGAGGSFFKILGDLDSQSELVVGYYRYVNMGSSPYSSVLLTQENAPMLEVSAARCPKKHSFCLLPTELMFLEDFILNLGVCLVVKYY